MRHTDGCPRSPKVIDAKLRLGFLKLCSAAIVPVELWSSPHTAENQQEIGRAIALLQAGCRFTIDQEDSDEQTWAITIFAKGFDGFSYGHPDEEHRFLIPTEGLLRSAMMDMKDWSSML